ncbi:hypothetical protein RP20_CCG011146 [Aedes albopictus]|nr:hypothetical protein RP20_CCG011146 [Aedes albopictus]
MTLIARQRKYNGVLDYRTIDELTFVKIRASSSMQKPGKGEPVDNDEFESWVKSKQLLKPDDQLDLTEAELGEEIPKLLSTENRHLPRNLVIYNFHEGTYEPVPPPENTVTLLEFEGTALHKDTPEAKEQIARKGTDVDFMKQGNEGAVCLFTIKNPSFPDYRITTESGAMCCDIHPKYPYLIAVGLYDGNVIVYNLQVGTKEPVYMSHGVNGKHSESVWELKWGPDMQDGEINFFTVSGDGRVFNWVLMQNKLAITTIISLFLDIDQVGGPDGSSLKLKGCGMCMVFHPNNPEIFLVGTEEGYIFKCSTAYSSKYLMTYYAHYLSVHRMDYNKFNSNIFASCSGDWRVKIWEDMRPEPLFIFDLGASVGDVKWAPYSSTVFAAVTTEGKVFVFDLSVNKYKAICVQAVVSKRKNKLSRIAFNHKLPFIIVGDDKGTTITLKLSPNLRIKTKAPKKTVPVDPHSLEVQKLDRLLSLVRELPEGELVKETVSTVASN